MANNRARYEEALRSGHAYSWDQQWQEAVDAFQIAIAEVPQEPAPYAGLAMACLELNRLEDALENYKLAARYSQGDIIYLRQVADVQERLGLDSEAGRTYAAIGEVELDRRRLNDAMDNWHRAVSLAPNLLRPHQRLATVYEKQGAAHSAIREYLAIARILQAEGENNKALQACRLALQLDPRNKDVLTAIEMIRQGDSLADNLGGQGESSDGPIMRMTAALGGNGTNGSQEIVVSPVEDARRVAMEQLAEKLFEESSNFERAALISQALDAQRRDLTNEAIGFYEQAIAAGIRGPAVHFNLGLLYQDKLRFEDAIREFNISVKDHEFRLASHFALGESYRARGHIDKSVEHFITVLQIVDLSTVQHEHSDRLIELYENLADSLITKGERDQATAFANTLVEFLSHKGWEDKVKEARNRLDAISNSEMMILGDILTAGSQYVLESLYLSQEYARRKMYDTAIEETYRAIQLSPDYLPAHLQLADVLAQEGRSQAASTKYMAIADTYWARNDTNGAIMAYEKVLDLAPLDLKVRTRLIDILRQNGRIDDALSHYISMGQGYYQLAQVDKARETYQEAMKLAPRGSEKYRVQLLQLLADIDTQRFDWRRALLAYKELRQLKPEDERIAITLIDLFYKVRQPNNAVRELDQYLIQLVRTERGNKVIGILEDMIQKRPHDANLADRLYRLYAQQNRIQEAVQLLDKVGEAQLEQGDIKGATATIEKIITLNPSNLSSYQQLLVQLRKQA